MHPTRAFATVATFALLLLSLAAGRAPSVAPAPATTQPSGDAVIKVALQKRGTWTFSDPAPVVTFDNQFSGARVNDCTQVAPHDYRILITPENEPINPSPWYAFRVTASTSVEITVGDRDGEVKAARAHQRGRDLVEAGFRHRLEGRVGSRRVRAEA
jgi:hypothetical protein